MQRQEPAAGSDYLAHARLRTPQITQRATGETDARPYQRPRPNRYDTAPAITTTAKTAAAPLKTIATSLNPTISLPVSLKDEFDRVKRGQTAGERKRRRFIPASRRGKFLLFAPLILLLIAGGVLGQTVFNASRAYRNIFVAQVPHADTGKFVVKDAGNGAKVIVQAAPTQQTAPVIPDWNGTDRITLLLLGVDQRTDEASRTDTMILVNVDPVTKSASMMSIPRDLKVIVPGYGIHKVNAAYAFGDADKVPGAGPGLAIRTIEANFGITVDYYAQINFVGFTKLIDTVGGLTLDVPYPIKDDAYPGAGNNYLRIFFKAGWQHMNGTQVLEYARTRHDDGDERRSARQQQVLLALRQQAVTLNLLTKAADLFTEFGDTVRTDMPLTKALQLAKLGAQIDPASIKQISLDSAMSVQQIGAGPYYLIGDWNKIGVIMSDFMGVKIVPPMSALANPDYHMQIVIQDQTSNPGLGARVAAVIKANGFTNVTVAANTDAGLNPSSSVAARSQDLSTAYLVAGLVGMPIDSITVNDAALAAPVNPAASSVVASSSDAATPNRSVALFPTPTPVSSGANTTTSSGQVVIVLGADAKDPAYFSNAPYDAETSAGPTPTSSKGTSGP